MNHRATAFLSIRLLSVLALAGGCASAYNAAQYRAVNAAQVCLRTIDAGQAFVALGAKKDGTLEYVPLRNPAAQARFAECLRTDYPELKVDQLTGPK